MTDSFITVKTIVSGTDFERISNKLGDRQFDLADAAREGYDLVTTVTLPLEDGLSMIVDTLARARQ